MRKKLLSLALTLALCLGLAVPAFAETVTETIDGITITASSDGTLSYTGTGTLTEEHLLYGVEIAYVERGEAISINIAPGITGVPDVSWFEEWFCEKRGAASVTINSAQGVQTVETVEAVGGFTDVKKSDYFADPVAWAVDKKITSGTTKTTFSPGKNCSVAEILTFLYQAYGAPRPDYTRNPFTDVKTSDWYYGAARWAYEKGIVSGGTFGGSRPCTRSMAVNYMWKASGAAYADFEFADGYLAKYTGSSSEVVIPNVVTFIGMDWYPEPERLTSVTIPSSVTDIEMMAFYNCDNLTDVYYEGSEAQWKAIKIEDPQLNEALSKATIHYNSKMPEPSVNTGFTDVPANADYAQAVSWAVDKGVTAGVSKTQFGPDVVCTRGQIVTFLYAALKK